MLLNKTFSLISLLGQFIIRFACENVQPFNTHSHILPNISNAHYSLFGVHDSSLSLSRSNRCIFYPRCLLFSCCDKALLERTSTYFHGDGSFPFHFSCMKTGKCLYSLPLAERLKDLDIMNITLTIDLLADLLLILPPTSPRVYKELAARKEFKILYLTQGDYYSKLETCLHQFQDMIFLSYKERVKGILLKRCLQSTESTYSIFSSRHITYRPLIFPLRKVRSWANGTHMINIFKGYRETLSLIYFRFLIASK